MRISLDSFRAQIAITVFASLSMLALAWLLAEDILTSTRERLLAEAREQCIRAAKELSQQYKDRANLGNEPVEILPVEALDVSLRGLSLAVLRAYEGMAGGFYLAEQHRMAGDVPPGGLESRQTLAKFERDVAHAAIGRIDHPGETAVEVASRGRDVYVAAAHRADSGAVAWTLKRLAEARDPVLERRRWWLAALVFTTVLGLGGIISIMLYLRRGVGSVNEGLRRLEEDFAYRMPAIGGQFGAIAEAINRMSDRRGALETRLRRQDRLAALGRVVSGVAHEIRNPLNSIRLTLELLERRVRRGALRSDEVWEAIEEVDRLDQILGRLLEFGKAGLEERRRQNVRPLLERAIKLVQEQAQSKQIHMRLDTAAGAPLEAEVDGLQLEQVLINLLLNAIDASPPGQEVRISAGCEGDNLRIRVEDRGPGIPPDARDHIFDPYFTTKDAGTGLGLAMSREVVLRHGGTLEFDTGPDGTVFTLAVPSREAHS
ncbi:MAG: hypothetical protein LC130_02200 [Bryobacterales bacterium]|nr:hypothetical protein [Bryobacterales bacterium]